MHDNQLSFKTLIQDESVQNLHENSNYISTLPNLKLQKLGESKETIEEIAGEPLQST